MQFKRDNIISAGIVIAFFYLLYDYIYPARLVLHIPLIYVLIFAFIIVNVKNSLERKKFFGILCILVVVCLIIILSSNSLIPLELNSEEGIMLTFMLPLIVILAVIIVIKGYNIIMKNKTHISKLIKKVKKLEIKNLKFSFSNKPK